METVKKAGERFTHQGKTFTVKSFFGSTGIEYQTADEAKKANPKDSLICVKNVEYEGATELRLSKKL